MKKSLDQRFGEVLRSLREAAGKTQEDFSSIGRTYLSELERGLKTPTLETIVRLAAELGVTPAQLVELATTGEPLPAAEDKGDKASSAFARPAPLAAAAGKVAAEEHDLPHLLAEAALIAFRSAPGSNPRERHQRLRFLVADEREADQLEYAKDGDEAWSLSPRLARRAVEQTNRTLELANDVLGMNGIPCYELLGTRNLGSFVRAVFVCSLQHEMRDRLPSPVRPWWPWTR